MVQYILQYTAVFRKKSGDATEDNVAEWLRRRPAKALCSHAQVRILSLSLFSFSFSFSFSF